MKNKILIYIAIFILIVVLIIIVAKSVPEKAMAPTVNGIGLLVGFFYFIERLNFDKHANKTRNLRERLTHINKDLNELLDISEKILNKEFQNKEDFEAKKRQLQMLSIQLCKITDIMIDKGNINRSISRPILMAARFVENSEIFLAEYENVCNVDNKSKLRSFHFIRGNAIDSIYTMLLSLD